MSVYAKHVNRLKTPQNEKADPRQVENNAGGYTFKLDLWGRLDRFLVLGTVGGTYYVGERELTKDNASVVEKCLKQDPARTITRIVEISETGRAPSNSPAIFALALACADAQVHTRKVAFMVIPQVCRIGTHLFEFVTILKNLRGIGGQGISKALGEWYASKTTEQLTYQVLKYQQRHGWSHKDVLGMIRRRGVKNVPIEKEAIFRWVCCGMENMGARKVVRRHGDKTSESEYFVGDIALPRIICAHEDLKRIAAKLEDTAEAKKAEDTTKGLTTSFEEIAKAKGLKLESIRFELEHGKTVVEEKVDWSGEVAKACTIIKDHRMTHEMVPTILQAEKSVGRALLMGDGSDHAGMPLGALIRSLGKFTANGVIAPMSDELKYVCDQLRDEHRIQRARIHPLGVLLALSTYRAGRGVKGRLSWNPIPQIADALNNCFYKSFKFVKPTGKRILMGIDVSASMTAKVNNSHLSCREAAAAMSMATAKVEENRHFVGFMSKGAAMWGVPGRKDQELRNFVGYQVGSYRDWTTGVADLDISPHQRLDDICSYMSGLPMGGTDIALPILWAMQHKMEVDAFCVYTDKETWAGPVHVHQALTEYRKKFVPDAKLIVSAMSATEYSVADPTDPLSLDVVGFDAATPAIISNFIAPEQADPSQ